MFDYKEEINPKTSELEDDYDGFSFDILFVVLVVGVFALGFVLGSVFGSSMVISYFV